jgi:hypothetical protein
MHILSFTLIPSMGLLKEAKPPFGVVSFDEGRVPNKKKLSSLAMGRAKIGEKLLP